MSYLTRAEMVYLRRRLDGVRHITLDPEGPGVVRIHLVPRKGRDADVPFVAILNGQDILPLSVSWAILLSNLMDVLQPREGEEITPGQWRDLSRQAVEATRKIYRATPADQISMDLNTMLDVFQAVARGEQPPIALPAMSLGQYAPYMVAPHRMDLLVSSMMQDGAWHCNQKCLHCYAAHQPLGEVAELDTDQWLAILEKCRSAGIPQVTFTGGEPTLRRDLVQLVNAAQWFVTRLNTNGRMLTTALCRDLAGASLDAVQVTLYSADPAVHNTLVGTAGHQDTVDGIRNAVAAGLNVSINTPLCSLNRDYRSTVALAGELGVRYLTCSGLIPAGAAARQESAATRLSPEELTACLEEAMDYAAAHHIEMDFTSPGWLPEETLRRLGFVRIPSCGACLSNMAVSPDGTVLPCQSWLSGPGLGNLLRTPWHRIWNGAECRRIRQVSAQMLQRCQLGPTPQGGPAK